MVENIITSGATLTLLGMAGVLAYGSVFHLIWHYCLSCSASFSPCPDRRHGGSYDLTGLILAGRIGARWMIAWRSWHIAAGHISFSSAWTLLMVQSAMSSHPTGG
jgi:hypothetical protein